MALFLTLYLLQGQFDTKDDWWSAKGQLPGILAGIGAPPMLLPMPFCALPKLSIPRDQWGPALDKFVTGFDLVDSEIHSRWINPDMEGLLGISMGGKQAPALVLTSRRRFSALDVLSGKLQDDNYGELKSFAESWPQNLAKRLSLYFHYCNRGGTDDRFYSNNGKTCAELGGRVV